MIKDIEVQNYRGINKLKIGNFEKYNLFVGNNGGCKSTMLESLIIGRSAFPSEFFGLGFIRGELNREDILNSSLRKTKQTVISLNNNELRTEFTLKKASNGILTLLEEQKNSIDKKNISSEREIIKEYLFKKEYLNEIFSGEIKLETNNEFSTKFDQTEFKDSWSDYFYGHIYISAYFRNKNELVKYLANFLKEKKEHLLVNLLKIFDKNIEGIKLIENDIYVDLMGAEALVPLYSIGTGLTSILIIIMTILNNQDAKLICIDEIETGIHYLNYKKLAEIILELTKEEEKQVFITTHSNEFLNTFYKVLYKHKQKMKVYQFKRNKENEISCSEYSNEEIQNAVLSGWDLR